MNLSTRIDSYNLFGETAELADVLHVETIRARSELHDWELRPHRHARLHQLLVLISGTGEAELDGNRHYLTPPCLINVPRGVVHGFRFGSGTGGWVITLTSDLLDQNLTPGEGVRALLDLPAVRPLPGGLQDLAEQLFSEYCRRRDFGRAQMLRGLALSLTAAAARAIAAGHDASAQAQHSTLFARFEALVERDFRLRRPLAEYADELAVSPTHLNRIAHQATGQPASALVNARVLREARRLLIYTNLTAVQIAYELGFNDPAHFSRMFAKGTGMPPRKFRQQLAGSG
ncbi:helix-turn-helix domain-containing protein [Leisingera daeponensis]|uniref:Helix-turn-helix domain-containing protein n=1 Tax=Leisingera daeponensis TaxID=405746 RepID=A0ABS7NEZ2_9RHOB|nr:helix-turn-helix domain-containing protein [Leisingera daeponensis]MBY6139788.1 helix-turn-helix domain-containing protein [Leisingera daeponensis]